MVQRIALIGLMSFALAAQAQVYRCKDASGRTVYSDAACPSNSTGAVIERRKTEQEVMAERLQAAEANERKWRQRAFEAQQEARMQARAPDPVPPPAYEDRSSSYECKRALRNQETVSSIRTGTPEERRNRINAETMKVNAACGTSQELMQEPPRVVHRPRPPPRPMNCVQHGVFINCH